MSSADASRGSEATPPSKGKGGASPPSVKKKASDSEGRKGVEVSNLASISETYDARPHLQNVVAMVANPVYTSSPGIDICGNTPTSDSENHETTQTMPHNTAKDAVIQIWRSRRNEIAGLREIVLTKRLEVKRERTLYYQRRQDFEDLLSDILVEVNSESDDHGSPNRKQKLNDLESSMKICGADMKTLFDKCSRAEESLSSHEYKLEKLEEEIYWEMDDGAEESYNQASQEHSLALDHANRSNLKESPTNLRDELYSRMSDVRIIMDRLSSFEYELRRDIDEREYLRAGGQMDITSDEVFFEEARTERQKLQQDLEAAQIDVNRLKMLCIQMGIEFQDVPFPTIVGSMDDSTFTGTSQSSEAPVTRTQGSLGIIDAFYNQQKRVTSWLSSGPSAAADQEGAGRPLRLEDDWSDIAPERRVSTSRSLDGSSRLPEYSGPPPGSSLIEALMLEATLEPMGQAPHLREGSADF